MHIALQEISDGKDVLAGATFGSRCFGRLVQLVDVKERTPGRVFVDFQGISLITGSFFRECVIAFRDFCSSSATSYYPVLSSLSEQPLEEVSYVLEKHYNDAMYSCSFDDRGMPHNFILLGHLDLPLHKTLNLVEKFEICTPPMLHEENRDEGISPTAWNNRLSALANKRLIIENQTGRKKSYASLISRPEEI